MSTKSISISNLETGEVFDTNIRLNDDKFMARGYKMYNDGVIRLFTALTKTEAIKATDKPNDKSNEESVVLRIVKNGERIFKLNKNNYNMSKLCFVLYAMYLNSSKIWAGKVKSSIWWY